MNEVTQHNNADDTNSTAAIQVTQQDPVTNHTLKMRSSNALFFTFILSFLWMECQAFVVPKQCQSTKLTICLSENDNNNNNNNNQSDESDESVSEALNSLLDKQFFDPDRYDEDDTGPLAWFANFVKRDYEFAETVYVGVYLTVLVIITQEVLRMQLYGDRYIPFTKFGNGHLF